MDLIPDLCVITLLYVAEYTPGPPGFTILPDFLINACTQELKGLCLESNFNGLLFSRRTFLDRGKYGKDSLQLSE